MLVESAPAATVAAQRLVAADLFTATIINLALIHTTQSWSQGLYHIVTTVPVVFIRLPAFFLLLQVYKCSKTILSTQHWVSHTSVKDED